MASLNITELQKLFTGNHPMVGQIRVAKLVDKIAKSEPFQMNNGKTVIIDYASNSVARKFKSMQVDQLETLKRRNDLFVDATITRKTYVKLNQLKKTAEFGGGSGSGGGAEDTKYTESMQCYYCSYVFNIAKKTINSASLNDLNKGSRFVQATKQLNDCIKNGPQDWVETDVYIKTANKIYEEYGSRMRGTSYWHRDSRFMNNVYDAKKECHNIDKKSDDPQAPGSFSNDKWNPGDIWASTLSPYTDPLKDFTSSWGELNAEIYRMSQTGELLGISLKKIGAHQKTARFSEFNSPKLKDVRKKYKYKGITFGNKGEFFSSQDIYMGTNEGRIQFRTFGGDTSWQGEIKGTSASGGKIGGGNVHFYCKQILKKGIYYNYQTEKEYLAWIKRAEKTGEFQDRMYDLYSKLNSRTTNSQLLISKDEFLTMLNSQDYNFKNSKAICLEFMDVIMKGSAQQRDKLVTKLFRYAQSDLDQSSYFVKLY